MLRLRLCARSFQPQHPPPHLPSVCLRLGSVRIQLPPEDPAGQPRRPLTNPWTSAHHAWASDQRSPVQFEATAAPPSSVIWNSTTSLPSRASIRTPSTSLKLKKAQCGQVVVELPQHPAGDDSTRVNTGRSLKCPRAPPRTTLSRSRPRRLPPAMPRNPILGSLAKKKKKSSLPSRTPLIQTVANLMAPSSIGSTVGMKRTKTPSATIL